MKRWPKRLLLWGVLICLVAAVYIGRPRLGRYRVVAFEDFQRDARAGAVAWVDVFAEQPEATRPGRDLLRVTLRSDEVYVTRGELDHELRDALASRRSSTDRGSHEVGASPWTIAIVVAIGLAVLYLVLRMLRGRG